MQKYRVVGKTLRLTAGRVGLTSEQAARRKSMVRETGEAGVYDLMRPVEFKVGEVVLLDHVPEELVLPVEEV